MQTDEHHHGSILSASNYIIFPCLGRHFSASDDLKKETLNSDPRHNGVQDDRGELETERGLHIGFDLIKTSQNHHLDAVSMAYKGLQTYRKSCPPADSAGHLDPDRTARRLIS